MNEKHPALKSPCLSANNIHQGKFQIVFKVKEENNNIKGESSQKNGLQINRKYKSNPKGTA